jgi:hypothetical protein
MVAFIDPKVWRLFRMVWFSIENVPCPLYAILPLAIVSLFGQVLVLDKKCRMDVLICSVISLQTLEYGCRVEWS